MVIMVYLEKSLGWATEVLVLRLMVFLEDKQNTPKREEKKTQQRRENAASISA